MSSKRHDYYKVLSSLAIKSPDKGKEVDENLRKNNDNDNNNNNNNE